MKSGFSGKIKSSLKFPCAINNSNNNSNSNNNNNNNLYSYHIGVKIIAKIRCEKFHILRFTI